MTTDMPSLSPTRAPVPAPTSTALTDSAAICQDNGILVSYVPSLPGYMADVLDVTFYGETYVMFTISQHWSKQNVNAITAVYKHADTGKYVCDTKIDNPNTYKRSFTAACVDWFATIDVYTHDPKWTGADTKNPKYTDRLGDCNNWPVYTGSASKLSNVAFFTYELACTPCSGCTNNTPAPTDEPTDMPTDMPSLSPTRAPVPLPVSIQNTTDPFCQEDGILVSRIEDSEPDDRGGVTTGYS